MATQMTYVTDYKVKAFYESLNLPIDYVEFGNTGIISYWTRELTPEEQTLLERVVMGEHGMFVAPEGIDVTGVLEYQEI